MKHQALFSSKYNSKKIKVSSAAILLGCLWVNESRTSLVYMKNRKSDKAPHFPTFNYY